MTPFGITQRILLIAAFFLLTAPLSGYMIARSGRTLTFSFFANDVPGGGSATATMDAVLATIAEAN